MRIKTIVLALSLLCVSASAQAGVTVGSPTIATVGLSTFNVTWISTVAATGGYTVEASTFASIAPATFIATSVSSVTSSLNLVGLSPNTIYFVRVGGISAGTTSYVNTSPAGASTLASLVSGAHIYQIYDTSVTVNWVAFSPGSGINTATGYLVQASTFSGFTGLLLSTSTSNVLLSTLTLSGLASGATYYLRVGALNWGQAANSIQIGSIFTAATTLFVPNANISGSGLGAASILPAGVPEGGVVTSTLAFSVPSAGMALGGRLEVDLPSGWWPLPQTITSSQDGFVVLSTTATATLNLVAASTSSIVYVYVQSGSVPGGTQMNLSFQNVHPSCPAPGQTQIGWAVKSALSLEDPLVSIANQPAQSYTAGQVQWVGYNPWNPLTVVSGQASQAIAVQGNDNCGQPVAVASPLAISLQGLLSNASVDSGAVFSSNPNFSVITTSVTIPASSSTAVYYYKTSSAGANLQIRGDYLSPVGSFNQQVWRQVNVLAAAVAFFGITVDSGVVAAGQTAMTLSPDGSGINNFAYIRFTPSDGTIQWHVAISRDNFQTFVYERWGSGNPQGTLSWDGRNSSAGGNTVGGGPPIVPNGTYTVKVEVPGLVSNTSLSITVNSAQISGTVTVGGAPVPGAQVNAQGVNAPGYSFTTTDASGSYTLNGLRSGFQYNLYASYVSPSNQSVVTGRLNIVGAPSTGKDFVLTTPGVIRVSAVIPSSGPFPVFGSINAHSSDYSKNYWGNLRLLQGAATSDNGDSFNPSSWTVLYVQPGAYILHFTVPGFGLNDVTVTASSDVIVNLQHKAGVYGLITLPAPAANNTWVSVEGALQNNSYPTVWGGASFNVGQSTAIYAIYAVDAGVYTFRARPDGYVPLALPNITVTSADIGNAQTGGQDFSGFTTGGHISGTVTVHGDSTGQSNPFTLWINALSSLGANVFTQVQLPTDGAATSASYQINGVSTGTYQVFPPYLPGFEANPSGPQTVTVTGVAGGAGTLNLTLNQVTGRVTGTVALGGPSDYAGVHLSLQGPYQKEVNLSAAAYSLNHLGTGNYTLVATYKTTGAQTRTSFTLSNGQTLALNLDLSAATYSVSGALSVLNAFTLRNSSNSLTTINTLTDLLASATSQVVTLDASTSGSGFGPPGGCAGGTPNVLSTVRVEAFPKNFNSFNNANRSSFNNCFGVGEYKYGVVTSTSGAYFITGLSPGVWEISVYPYFDGGQIPNTAVTKQMITVANGSVTGVDFPLSNGYSVSGTISLPAGVTDTRSFNAQILTPRGDLLQSSNLMLTGANAVSYQFTGLPSGPYSLLIQDFGTYDQTLGRNVVKYVSKPVQFTVAGADLTSVDVTIGRGSSIVGKLLIQGANPDGTAALTLITANNQNLLPNNFRISADANPWVPGGSGQAESGSGGGIAIDGNNQFHIDGLGAATYDVIFKQDSFGNSIQGKGSLNIASLKQGAVPVSESQVVDLGSITLVPGLSLTGTVSDSQGRGLSNISIEARPAASKNGDDTIQAFSDAQGNFTLAGLNPAIKTYSIIAARRPGPNENNNPPVPYGTVSKLAVDVTQVPSPVLNFVLPTAQATLTGKVVTIDHGSLAYPDNDNAGFPVAAIYLRSQGSVNEDNPLGDTSATALDGAFSIPYIPAGVYDITVESLGYRPLKITGVTLAAASKNLGTLTLQKGPSLQVLPAKPDGSSVNTSDVRFAIAATADLGSIIFGQITSDANTSNITAIKFSGFELSPKSYSLLLFDNQDNIVVPPEGKALLFTSDTDSVVKTMTYLPSAPFAFTHIRKVDAAIAMTYYLSRPLRNRGDDTDPKAWFSITQGAGTLSKHSVSADRRQITVTYNPAVGEQNAAIAFSAHTVDIDPATGVEFVISKSLTLLLGQKATSEGNINPALGGSVSLATSNDPSNVSLPSNVLLSTDGTHADVSVSYNVTFSATDPLTSAGAGAVHGSRALALDSLMARGASAYLSEAYLAMQTARAGLLAGASASVDPFSSFYSVLLPAGISHRLNQNATLTLTYDTNADPALLNVYYFDGTHYLIETNNRVIDTVNHTISVGVSHFSTFVVLQNASPVILVDGDAAGGADIEVMNFPNPFDLQTKTKALTHGGTSASITTTGTIIRYVIPAAKAGAAHIDIYNVVGEKVRSIDLGVPAADAYHYADWDGKNDSGHHVASGVYVGILKAGGAKKTWKMAVIK